MSGSSLVSGRFEGRDDLYAHMERHVLGPLVIGSESYVKGSRIVLVDDALVVGLLHGGLPARDGGRYDQYYLQIFRLENGLIAEIVELFDTVMVETVLMKNCLLRARTAPNRPFDLAGESVRSGSTLAEVKSLATDFAAALVTNDMVRMRAVANSDLCVKTIGTTPISGVSGGFDALAHALKGGVRDIRMVCSDSSGACLLMRSADGSYDQQYGLVLVVDAGRISEIIVFMDTVEAERALFNNPVLPAASKSIMPAFDISQAFVT